MNKKYFAYKIGVLHQLSIVSLSVALNKANDFCRIDRVLCWGSYFHVLNKLSRQVEPLAGHSREFIIKRRGDEHALDRL